MQLWVYRQRCSVSNICLDNIKSRAIWSSRNLNLQNRRPLLEKWVTDCVTLHQGCKSSIALENPTRLLDICPGGADAVDTVRLIDSKFLHEIVRYTTLSHRWGSSQSEGPLRTMKATEKAHHAGILVQKLSKTFQDAVQLTRAFSIRYLWIDSLCIIQDDPEDWENEAAKMAVYYENSHLCISAENSDLNPGCAIDRFNDELLMGLTSAEHRNPIAIRTDAGNYTPRSARVYQSALQRRGWILQEAFLSPRVVHCLPDQWYWQCSRLAQLEDGSFESETFDFVTSSLNRPLVVKSDRIRMWHELATAYSSRENCRICRDHEVFSAKVSRRAYAWDLEVNSGV